MGTHARAENKKAISVSSETKYIASFDAFVWPFIHFDHCRDAE
jgi:hypothetical protein